MDIWRNTERHDGIVRRFWRDFGEILPNNLAPSRCTPLHKNRYGDLKRDLDTAGVRNNGVEEDPETHAKYISFYDPDGIAWELYSISTRSEV